MKKLFNRSSKSSEQERGEIASITSTSASQHRSSGIMQGHHDLARRRHQSVTVTPFPIDAGRANGAWTPSQPNSTHGHGTAQPPQPVVAAMMQKPVPPPPAGAAPLGSTPPPRPPRDGARGVGQSDYRQMEEEASSAPFRRDGGSDRQSGQNSRSRSGTGGTGSSFPMPTTDPRSPGMFNAGRSPNDPPIAQMYARPADATTQPTPTQPAFYLPPGAGPPSPQGRPSTRPSTPPSSGRFTHSHRGSVPSLHNVPASTLPPHVTTASHEGHDGYTSARSRGYSSASQSGRGSDQEGSVHAPQVTGMLGAKGGQSPLNRSPLANNYNTTSNGDNEVLRSNGRRDWNTAGNRTSMPPMMGHHPSLPPAESNRMENLEQPPRNDSRHFFAGPKQDKDRDDKEKKKGFWSGWGDRKHNKLSKHQSSPIQGHPRHEEDAASSMGHGYGGPGDHADAFSSSHGHYQSSNGTSTTIMTAPVHLDKDLPIPVPSSLEDARQSADGYRGDVELSTAGHASSLGHGTGPEIFPKATSRSRSASNAVPPEIMTTPRENGVDRTPRDGDRARSRASSNRLQKSGPGDDDVYTLIKQLCSRRETTQNAVLEMCEKINLSEDPDAVSKNAARGLRKVFKHGTDPERRMATRIWWLTMRNIKARHYHHYATCRKFMAAVEPIVMNTLEPRPSAATHRWAIDVLAGLTWAYHNERGCEGLADLWRKVKLPEDHDNGRPLPDDFLLYHPDPPRQSDTASVNTAAATVRSDRTPKDKKDKPRRKRDKSDKGDKSDKEKDKSKQPRDRPKYQVVPSHEEGIQRLIVQASEGKEHARVLSEAVVHTEPTDFNSKHEILKQYYLECQRSFTSLSTQMDWAQSEAAKSRQVAGSVELKESGNMQTPEESALDLLFEVHSQLAYAMEQFDELARAAEYEQQLRAAEERSKKDTRMDRRQKDMLMVDETMRAEGSASRSASPGAYVDLSSQRPSQEELRQSYEQMRISQDRAPPAPPAPSPLPASMAASVPMTPAGGSAAGTPAPAHAPPVNAPSLAPQYTGAAVAGAAGLAGLGAGAGIKVLTNGHGLHSDRSSTPSPEDHPLPQRPGVKAAARAPSPAGKGRRMGGPRPLPTPNAFRSHNSTASLQAASEVHASSQEGTTGTPAAESSEELTDDAPPPKLPTRKALGKRRADPDNDFDPDSLFTGRPKPKPDNVSEDSISLDDVYTAKPVKYAYDAYAERLLREREAKAAAAAGAPVPAL